ncbi:hypothetical protein ES288_D12G001100v1 [Gossypium darwinii]|nr:hypothetical protein ES288_D12G001100v1 [Gossypium darwinii]
MVMMGMEFTAIVPFSYVYHRGLIHNSKVAILKYNFFFSSCAPIAPRLKKYLPSEINPLSSPVHLCFLFQIHSKQSKKGSRRVLRRVKMAGPASSESEVWVRRLPQFPPFFIDGKNKASNYLWELYYGGWAALNIYFLGFAGVVKFGNIGIGGLSGIYNARNYCLGHHKRPLYNDNTIRSVSCLGV